MINNSQKPALNLLAIILIFIIIALVAIVSYLFGKINSGKITKEKSIFPSKTVQEKNTKIVTTTDATITSSRLQTFTDNRLQNFHFQYNPQTWTIIDLPANSEQKLSGLKYAGPGVLVQESQGGVLYFRFTLAFGVGGGVTPFKENEVKILTNGWARIQKENTGYYGLAKNLVYFSQDPKELQSAKDYCQKLSQGEEMMAIFSTEDCTGINDGSIIGLANQPAFSRSSRFKLLTGIEKINPLWATDTYIEEEKLNDGYLIVETAYKGNNPELADEIVAQLKSD